MSIDYARYLQFFLEESQTYEKGGDMIPTYIQIFMDIVKRE